MIGQRLQSTKCRLSWMLCQPLSFLHLNLGVLIKSKAKKKQTKPVIGSGAVAAVTEGKHSRCSSSRPPHIEKIQKGEKCDTIQCTHCSKFYHNVDECFSNPNSSQFKGNPVNQISEATAPAVAVTGEINQITSHCNNINSCNKISSPTPRILS